MSKTQKIWMWIFIAMFALPEILFITSPALLMSILGKSFTNINSLVVNYDFFLAYPIYLLIIIATEFIGVAGLAVFSARLKKKIALILSGILLLWLLFIFAVVYITGFSMNW